MRIVYGVNSQGQGHFSKAAVLVPRLEARGHEVFLVSSGDAPQPGYTFTNHRHFRGLAYAVRNGRTNYHLTAQRWIGSVHRFAQSLLMLRKFVHEIQPDLIISDFEPLTASPLINPRCEVVSLCRQVALFDRAISLPPTQQLEKRLSRTAIRLFTAGADRLYGYHYTPASFRCVPPVIRSDFRTAVPVRGDHLLIYGHFDAGEPLVEWANRHRRELRIYGFHDHPRGQFGYAHFRTSSRAQMVEDMRTARAVLTNAGFTTPVEAFLLRKPTLVIPIANQWEQVVNTIHLSEAGLGVAAEGWDLDLAWELPPPQDSHPFRSWLNTTPDEVLDHVLGERHHKLVPSERHLRTPDPRTVGPRAA